MNLVIRLCFCVMITVTLANFLPVQAQESSPFNPQSEFNRGNYLYEQREYDAAIEVYRAIENEGYISGPLMLNTGMSYVRLDSLGPALYYFHRAEAFPQTRQSAREGIDHINGILHARHTPIPVLTTYSLDRWLHTVLGVSIPLIIGFILLNLAALFRVVAWFIPKRDMLFRYSSYFFVFAAITAFVTAGYVYESQNKYQYGMFIENGHEVYESPDPEGSPVFVIYEGYTFRLDLDETPDGAGWAKVAMSNGIEGWVRTRGYRLF